MTDRLVIFAKAPRRGTVKTRLEPRLGADGALEVYRAFVGDVLARMRAAATPTRSLVVYHSPSEPGDLLEDLDVELRIQRGADLGARLDDAFRRETDGGAARVVVIGCDSPDLPAVRIEEAFAALDDAELVLGPAVDGGYYLIGSRGVPSAALHEVSWGSDEVLAQTLDNVIRAGGSVATLDPWYDVDRPEDLTFLHTHLRLLLRSRAEDRCPRTRAVLDRLLGTP